ncbi:hypothetical protein ACLMJK_008127 [Lecanora helva]
MPIPSYQEALSSAEFPHTMISTMSYISFHHKEPSTEQAYRRSEEAQKKHLTLLDVLAILLIFEDRSELAATAMIRETDKIRIMWAKNDPQQPSLGHRQYITGFAESYGRLDRADDILSKVFEACKRKILNRCTKAKRAFHSATVDVRPEFAWKVSVVERSLRDRSALGMNRSLMQGLTWSAEGLKIINNTNSTRPFMLLINFAYSLTSDEPSIRNTVSQAQFAYFRKLGEYRLIVVKVRQERRKLPIQVRQIIIVEKDC